MDRHFVSIASVCLLVCLSTTAIADQGVIPACRLGWELRTAMGFGPRVLSVLEAGATSHNTVMNAAEAFCEQNRQTIEPALEAVRTARKNAFRAYELGGDVATADQALLTAIGSLASACGNIATSMDGHLTPSQRTLRARVADNRLLDVRLRMLELTEQQRTSLRTAQRTRDLAFRHHKERKNLTAVKEAHEAFETAVSNTLTQAQQTQYEAFGNAQWQNFGDALAREEAHCGD